MRVVDVLHRGNQVLYIRALAPRGVGDEVAKPCRATATGLDKLSCTVSDPKSWCGFATAAPADVLASYSTYATKVASFIKANSATISIQSTSCRAAWVLPDPGKQESVKIAMVHDLCYLQAHPETDAISSSTGTSVLSSTISSTAKATTTATNTVAGHGQTLGTLALMNIGLVVLVGAV